MKGIWEVGAWSMVTAPEAVVTTAMEPLPASATKTRVESEEASTETAPGPTVMVLISVSPAASITLTRSPPQDPRFASKLV